MDDSLDGSELAKHHTTKQQRKALAERMKDNNDEVKLVIVRNMWLTASMRPQLLKFNKINLYRDLNTTAEQLL
ncbi:hypothetical protein [Methylotuvimicrobium buryatense]|uniref:Uncharacterized protein n=1 Tax=Methylotuvimicrobium buryatense TaxID=95641 RepID=A0A4V1IJV0_METBY|nr:hypothetical protein [Methylotuvimicrobium buryatense]QCW82675.1 hypothetical protein EQU24_10840 [Methylotuvimicrobium buryatense]